MSRDLSIVSGDTEPARCAAELAGWVNFGAMSCELPAGHEGHHEHRGGYPGALTWPEWLTAPASDDGTPTDPPRCAYVYQQPPLPDMVCERLEGWHDTNTHAFFSPVPAPEPEGTALCTECGQTKDGNTDHGIPFSPEGHGFKSNREGTPGLSEAKGHDCNAYCVFKSWVSDIRGGLPNTPDLGIDAAYEAIRAEAVAPIEAELQRARREQSIEGSTWAKLLSAVGARAEKAEEQLQQAREDINGFAKKLMARDEALQDISAIAKDGAHFYTQDHWLHRVVATIERALATPLEGVGHD